MIAITGLIMALTFQLLGAPWVDVSIRELPRSGGHRFLL